MANSSKAKAGINKTVTKRPGPTSGRTKPFSKVGAILPWLLIIGGVLGILSAAIITQEKFDLASNPHYQPICDLNPVISCGSVMQTKQAHTFGFMNPFIGLIGFPILITIGVGILAGATFKRWFWQGMQLGLTFGILFAYWLLFESVYRIHALCPWCLTVDVVITTLFWYITLYNFYTGNLSLPARFRSAGRLIKQHHLDILILWFIVVIAIILKHFWYYFGQHI
jgi:uncharacterized membrane protein